MLNILGPASRYCDGITRRSALKIGAFAFGASYFSLTDLYRAEAQTSAPISHKAVINVYLGGGPPHQDMWDIKTEAPRKSAANSGRFKPTCPEFKSAKFSRASLATWINASSSAPSPAVPIAMTRCNA